MKKGFLLFFSFLLMLVFNVSAFAALEFNPLKAIKVTSSAKITSNPVNVTEGYGLIFGAFGFGIVATVDDSIIYDIPRGDFLFAYSYHSYNNEIFKDIITNDYLKKELRDELGLGDSGIITDELLEEALKNTPLGGSLTKKIVIHEFSISEKITLLRSFYIKGGLGYYNMVGTMENEEDIKDSAISPILGFGYGTSFRHINGGFFYDYSFAKFTADFDFNGEEETLGLGGQTFGLFIEIKL